MPWKNECPSNQRWVFVQEVMRGLRSLAELCREVPISRKTAYKWIERFKEGGRREMVNQLRRAREVHNRPKKKWLNRIRRWKVRHPSWGAPKIHWILKKRFGSFGLPSEAATSRWLKNWGLSRRSRTRLRKGPCIDRPVLQEATVANEVWTVDFKGWFKTAEGIRIDPLTVRDLASRYILWFALLRSQTIEMTRQEFEKVFARYGLPLVIRVDNGTPFGSTGALGLTRLSAWWLKLGIKVEFIEPGHPEQNGGHEQMHRMYKAEILTAPVPGLRTVRKLTQQWCLEYNTLRPHEGIKMEVPAKYYRKSPRKRSVMEKPWSYSGEWESRLVKGKGMISLNGLSGRPLKRNESDSND